MEQCEFEHKPRQIEFARLNLTNTMMSKRYLRRLVEEGHVAVGTIPVCPPCAACGAGAIRRKSIRDFLTRVGVAKADSVVETAMLEHCVREDLNAHAHRMMAVLDPIRLVVENWPEGKTEAVAMENLPSDPAAGSRTLTFSRGAVHPAGGFQL